jgi:hypothetical protein
MVDSIGPPTISAVYFQPNPIVAQEHLVSYNLLRKRLISGGDNAHYTSCGSRLFTPRGWVAYKTIERLHLSHLSTGEPSYWPTDINKQLHLFDFCVTKGIPSTSGKATSRFEL